VSAFNTVHLSFSCAECGADAVAVHRDCVSGETPKLFEGNRKNAEVSLDVGGADEPAREARVLDQAVDWGESWLKANGF
jgi:hypothetical protein